MQARSRQDRGSGAFVGATLLIVIGIIALVANLGGGENFYRAIPLGLGIAFLVAYAFTRQYGFLVPGGILAGAGVGLLLDTALGISDNGPLTAIGAGLGFILIFCVDVIVSRSSGRWWPVVPGAILVVAGAGTATVSDTLVHTLQVWSPLVLVAVGVLILLSRLRRPKS